MRFKSFRRFSRKEGSSAFTVTLSKKASTGPRSLAMAVMAAPKSSALDGLAGIGFGGGDGAVQVALLALDEKLGVGQAVKGAVVLLLLDLENVGGALDAGEKILAVIAFEEFGKRFDAADDHQEIILPAKREHGIDQIMPRALILEIDFETIGEEGEEIMSVQSVAPFHGTATAYASVFAFGLNSVLRAVNQFARIELSK